jgi:hypothetical protein
VAVATTLAVIAEAVATTPVAVAAVVATTLAVVAEAMAITLAAAAVVRTTAIAVATTQAVLGTVRLGADGIQAITISSPSSQAGSGLDSQQREKMPIGIQFEHTGAIVILGSSYVYG